MKSSGKELKQKMRGFLFFLLPFLRWACEFLFYYIYALFACLYVFTIGCLFRRNRRYIRDICTRFRGHVLLKRSKAKDGLICRDAESHEPPGSQRVGEGLISRDAEIKERLENEQFARYVMYLDIQDFIQAAFQRSAVKKPAIIEFGGSNGILKLMFYPCAYLVAENYPKVDIQNLDAFDSNCYDFVILDQILEHVPQPAKALQEIYRILKKGGWLITTTPFLVKIHPCPHDYWRFSKEGMELLLADFSEVAVKSWGNKDIVMNHIQTGHWPQVKEFKQAGRFNLENDEAFPHVIWGFARK